MNSKGEPLLIGLRGKISTRLDFCSKVSTGGLENTPKIPPVSSA